MRIAFYAPLKAPDHPVPSGDRLLARLFAQALGAAGHDVAVASRLRTYEGAGDAARQARLAHVGALAARRLVRRARAPGAWRPALWFTYHLYHKAPDPLGPVVCDALRIPYVVAEASHAPRQAGGPWDAGHRAAAAAIARADGLVCINPADVPQVDARRSAASRRVLLPPFIDVERFLAAGAAAEARAAAALLAPSGEGPLLCTVAMLRPGDKLASYRLLARTLARLDARPWRLVVVGDGAARADVHAAFAGFAPGRVRFAGTQPASVVAALLARADLYVWPAVAEVIGLAMLEAAAAGLPVVAGRRPGSASIIDDGVTGVLVPPGDAAAFADAVAALLDDPVRRAALGHAAARQARVRHDVAGAAAVLDALCGDLVPAPHGRAA